jgi:hypothetical protein
MFGPCPRHVSRKPRIVDRETGLWFDEIEIAVVPGDEEVKSTSGVNSPLAIEPQRSTRYFPFLVSGHADRRDASDLACCVEAEHETGGVAAREDEFDRSESLVAIFLGLHDFGSQRRRAEGRER